MSDLREVESMPLSRTQRIGEMVVGAILGLIVGAIVAVNVVITAGVDRGYEASLAEVFEESALLGVAVLVILVAGPFVGVYAARRIRRKMEQ
jgi:ABC-type antimicrobial peptide transport system permease subunit